MQVVMSERVQSQTLCVLKLLPDPLEKFINDPHTSIVYQMTATFGNELLSPVHRSCFASSPHEDAMNLDVGSNET